MATDCILDLFVMLTNEKEVSPTLGSDGPTLAIRWQKKPKKINCLWTRIKHHGWENGRTFVDNVCFLLNLVENQVAIHRYEAFEQETKAIICWEIFCAPRVVQNACIIHRDWFAWDQSTTHKFFFFFGSMHESIIMNGTCGPALPVVRKELLVICLACGLMAYTESIRSW